MKMSREFITSRGNNGKIIPRKSKYVNGAGCYKIAVEIDGKWKTVVSNCYLGRETIEKVKAEY